LGDSHGPRDWSLTTAPGLRRRGPGACRWGETAAKFKPWNTPIRSRYSPAPTRMEWVCG